MNEGANPTTQHADKCPKLYGEECKCDGYHTFKELYEFRLLYHAAFCNSTQLRSHKSTKHSDGEECFGGGWFIVVTQLPTGQISNHYEMKDWDLFDIPIREKADEWDGHTSQDVEKRLREFLN